jgi:superfamily I DNA/RNA helicase
MTGWDAVFLPGLEDGTLPIRQASANPASLAEERRLLYVGIIRARRHLVRNSGDCRLVLNAQMSRSTSLSFAVRRSSGNLGG